MSLPQAALTGWTRGGLALLCLLLGLSLTTRVYRSFSLPDAHEAAAEDETGGPVNLGRGVVLPRAAAVDRIVPVDGCLVPPSLYFFRAGPYGMEASLVGSHAPQDRIAYVYDGWTLGDGAATVGINAIYFARRVYARVTLHKKLAADDLAMKIVIPARCNASVDDVMTALRRDVQY